MSSRQYLVTLDGTWSRRDTTPDDITMMRNHGRKLAQRAATAVADAREFPHVTFSLTAKHPRDKHRRPQLREGTFQAQVRLPYWSGQFLTLASKRARATTMLRWFLQDNTCRAPELKVTSVSGRLVAS